MPLQILPDLIVSESADPEQKMNELFNTLPGQLPAADDKVTMYASFKEDRVPTKHLLLAVQNQLQQLWPGFTLASLLPRHRLAPISEGEVRVQMNKAELDALGFASGETRHFIANKAKHECRFDCVLPTDRNVHLTIAGDEGSPNWSMISWLAGQGCMVHYNSDIFHKAVNKATGAIARVPAMREALVKLQVVFRSTRAPFSSSKFGCSQKEAGNRLASAFRATPDHPLLTMFISGLARDMGKSLNAVDEETAIRYLQECAGQRCLC